MNSATPAPARRTRGRAASVGRDTGRAVRPRRAPVHVLGGHRRRAHSHRLVLCDPAILPRIRRSALTPPGTTSARSAPYPEETWRRALRDSVRGRRRLHACTVDGSTARVSGFVAPGFEEVRAEFERNFAERGEIGAAVAAYWRGEKVVDLWGGRRTPEGDAPWNEDTMVVVMSTTKGLAAMTLALANARGWLDYDAPVARYWPEFAQNGKADVTVRQLLGHEAGLVLLDEELPIEKLRDLDCRRARARAPETGVAARHAPRLPHDDARAVHAGADSPRRPRAPHARALLPRGDRGAARPRVLHRSAACDPRRAPGHGQDALHRACAPGVAAGRRRRC